MKAGAADFICKPFDVQTLLKKIKPFIANDTLLANSSALKAHSQYKLTQLSTRQRQIMELVVQGKLNKQIASELKISISTVEQHRAAVMKKMEAKTLADLIKKLLLV